MKVCKDDQVADNASTKNENKAYLYKLCINRDDLKVCYYKTLQYCLDILSHGRFILVSFCDPIQHTRSGGVIGVYHETTSLDEAQMRKPPG